MSFPQWLEAPCRAPRWTLDELVRRFASPGGRFENSPAVHCRDRIRYCLSPEGTVECLGRFAAAPVPTDVGVVQPSLRDERFLSHNPTLESVGYSQISLREMSDESTALPAHGGVKYAQTAGRPGKPAVLPHYFGNDFCQPFTSAIRYARIPLTTSPATSVSR